MVEDRPRMSEDDLPGAVPAGSQQGGTFALKRQPRESSVTKGHATQLPFVTL